ncbi:hypothetical protein EES41_41060 (plasmid) [Streptomyces sp. ADI95-16]|uniref:hypothetical protein n=1 Tax=Streptomyces sp. ADI95-16 TaxID=1522758 RepID=UPI000F4309AC|nr:hypothetical protein [Streptomyces sp. ADI95-16]AYV33170.1 hypothetical protein EES41_41060 [Streptomyces sp. ADI95-16]
MSAARRMVAVTMAGRTHEVPVESPRVPTDWRRRGLAVALAVTGALTVACVVWSTVSIAHLLGGGEAAYAGASVFDAAWLVVVLLEVYHRYDRARRAAAQRVGWALLVVSMAALIAYGIRLGDWGVAVGGPAVSLVAKTLWVAVLSATQRDLSPVAAGWVAAERDRAYAELAVAGVDLEVTRTRAAVAQQRAAMEAVYGPLAVAGSGEAPLVIERQEQPEHARVPDHGARLLERAAEDQARASASMDAAYNAGLPAREVLARAARLRQERPEAPEPEASAQVSGPEPAGTFRTGSGESPEERVPEQRPANLRSAVYTLYALGVEDADEITARLSAMLGAVSRASVDRYLREARAAASAKGP